MKNSQKRILAMLSIALLILSLCSCSQKNNSDIQTDSSESSYSEQNEEQFVNGGTITLGSYPQSKVIDENILSELNTQPLNWVSYGYYDGAFSWESGYGSMVQGDWMRYADVSLDGEKYRAVIFDEYRPIDTQDKAGRESEQKVGGFEEGVVYWYKYEPLKWRVLDAEAGLILSENIIDSQPFNNYIYQWHVILEENGAGNYAYFVDENNTIPVNDWAYSSVREWLNSDFYSTAFSENDTSKIQNSTLKNDGIQSWIFNHTNYDHDYADTQDKVFLLSVDDALNTAYGFSSETGKSETRTCKGTDYAIVQGLNNQGTSSWILRSATRMGQVEGEGPENIGYVRDDGYLSDLGGTSGTSGGIRPAMMINY